jgi:glycosyltransferase involved in cell wall biosynthesis
VTTEQATWSLYDYVSPGLHVVTPDEAFPQLRPGDQFQHPWKYTRRDVPHLWYAHEQFPHMGVINRDEAVLLHNIALQFAGRRALEIGSWIGWSTCHIALAGVHVDAIDPAHDDEEIRAVVDASLRASQVVDRVNLAGGSSPETIVALAAGSGRRWSLFFLDGDHEGSAPVRDALACLPYAADDCAFVFHDLASPDVAAGLRAMQAEGFHVVLYQTAQVMGLAWRGDVAPVPHVPDPAVAWQIPSHLVGLPTVGVDYEPHRPVTDRTLRDLTRPASVTTRPSVCIVSNEILGPFRNGGIGTSMSGLAEALAGEGLEVTILYTGNVWTPDVDLGRWRARYAELGIELDALAFNDMLEVLGPVRDVGFAAPYLVYRYLAARRFDLVHFNDCCGDGSLALVAKALGLDFQQTLLVIALHSPSQWVLELDQALPTSLLLTAFNYAERLSIRCADVAWSPSRYMLRWARDHDFDLPPNTFVQQYSIPGTFPAVAHGRAAAPRELVFFGRLEERKGLRLFCNALQLLADELGARDVSVTFLGKPQRCAGIDAVEYIDRRSTDWPFPVRVLTELDQAEALDYLRGGDRLAVMPSPADNSPCTVYEALGWGIPFLAARAGGIPELVAAADHERVLFDSTSESLHRALRSVLEQGGWIARPAVPQAETLRALLALHERWREFLPEAKPPPEARRWAAAIVDHRPGDDLDATLDSLAACPWIRRVVVLDRAGDAGDRGDRCVDLTREDPEVAAREILSVAEERVLLVHSGVKVVPHRLGRMLGALDAAPVDGLLPAAQMRDRSGVDRLVPPLGGSPAFSLFEGVTFTGAMLIKRRALTTARHGRELAAETPFVGLADFCVAGGATVWPYPEAVVVRRPDIELRVRSGLPARVAAYDDAPAVERYYMIATGYGVRSGEPSVSRRREVALALVDMGLAPGVRLASWAVRRARAARGRFRASGRLRRIRGR